MNRIFLVLITVFSISLALVSLGFNQAGISQRGDIIKDIIQSIPTPLEISSLIKETGNEYSSLRSNLNKADNVAKYNTNFQKAINLGIYGTDLGFANLYGRNQDALNYLTNVKKLSDGLDIGQFFDYNTLSDLVNTNNNLSELLSMTTSNFEKLNFHLRKQKRDYLSILILTGGWLEALYLTTKVYKQKGNAKLKDKIGEQKIVLDQIVLVLDVYKTKTDFPSLTKNLVDLQHIFDKIEIDTEYAPPVQKVVNGTLVIEDRNKSIVKIQDSDIEAIYQSVSKIRNNLIK